MDKGDCVPQPGVSIKPPVKSMDQVISLTEKLYGVTVIKITELNAYDDKNYHIIVSEENIKNRYMMEVWPHGYVLKIMNSIDSKDVGFVDAQNKLMLHISSRGISTPEPVRNVNGKYFTVEPFEVAKDGSASFHVVRLLKYQPGILLKSVKCSSSSIKKLYYDVGLKAAILNNQMKEFHHEAYSQRTSLWHLQNAPKVKEYLFAVNDNERVNLVLQVIDKFETEVLNNLNNLQQGLIHGDLNEMNILVDQHKDSDRDEAEEYRVTAIIDYGDSHISAYLFELAINVCYMILQSESLDAGTNVVEGYHRINPLPLNEYKLLPICVSARLCQSLVLGLYTATVDPTNHYVLQTQTVGWKMFNEITSTGREKINKLWMKNIGLS